MKYIKEQYDDFRNNTPTYVQWLLLAVAFLIVIILLTLLLSHKKEDNTPEVENQHIEFNVTPQNIKFDNVKVGESEHAKVNISVNVPVIIESVKIYNNDFTTPNNCVYDEVDSCNINVIYTPTAPQKLSNTTLVITWYDVDSEDTVNTEEIPVVFSSYKEPAKVVEPEVIPEPEPEPPFVDEPEPEPVTPVEEIKTIAIPNPIRQPEPEPEPIVRANPCSEFAIPGYDASGHQIGWIKPERGTNYFYPFSDKTCSNPTGKYDMATGVILSLKDGSRIGTDSDHIGYRNVRDRNLSMPKLSMPGSSSVSARNGEFDSSAKWVATGSNGRTIATKHDDSRKFDRNRKNTANEALLVGSGFGAGESVTSSLPYDRTFILRQFKPIPATIVSEVRADPSVYGCTKAGDKCDPKKNYSIPVRATVDRNVYSDDGRTIILPTGTLLMGYLDGDLPGPYQAFGRMSIKWYQFIRPDGVEFNFADGQDPYSADAQGRMGVPGHGSTDYIEQMVMPLLTSLVPAAVNMIAPIADTVINQIDLDNNTIVQSGTIRSSEMAKQDVINTWNKITQKLLVDAIDNTVPPFSIAAGTRINVFSPVDLIVSCQDKGINGKCSVITPGSDKRRKWSDLKGKASFDPNDGSWVGQVRSFDLMQYCDQDSKDKWTIKNDGSWTESGYEYRTVLLYCESLNYAAVNNAKQSVYNQNVQQQATKKYGTAEYDQKTNTLKQYGTEEQTKAYNTEVLGLEYDDEGNIKNPFAKPDATVDTQDILTCDDGLAPDTNGCCPGETFTDMGEDGWNCCPDTGGDCFPPITVE